MFVIPRRFTALLGLAMLLFAGSAAQAHPRASHCCCCCCCHRHVAHHHTIRHRAVYRAVEQDEGEWRPAPAVYEEDREVHLTDDFTGGAGPAFIGEGGGGGHLFVSGAGSASASASASAHASASVSVAVSASGHAGHGGHGHR